MSANYKKLGDYIQPVDIRNSDLKVSHLLGVSVEKCFIESIANTIGTDFSKYKIVRKGQFTYIPDTSRRGDKIGIALLTDFDEGLVSNIYTVFEITDTTKLLPEYLMLWFSRPEFDRYARYKSHGSVREIFDWDEMCRVELPVPDLKEQEKIVNTYNAITKRIQLKQKINENLEKTAQCLFENFYMKYTDFDNEEYFLPDNWKLGTLNDAVSFTNGYAFPSEDLLDSQKTTDCFKVFKMANIFKGGGFNYFGTKSYISKEYCKNLDKWILRNGDILMCMTDMKENIALLGHTALMDRDNEFIVNQRVGLIRPNNSINISSNYLYLLTNNKKWLKQLRKYAHIGVQVNLTTSDILNSPIILAPKEINMKFNYNVNPLFKTIQENNKEIIKLQELKQLVISHISEM